jgi:hypothetical protein
MLDEFVFFFSNKVLITTEIKFGLNRLRSFLHAMSGTKISLRFQQEVAFDM